MTLKFTSGHLSGNSYVSWAGEVLFSLFGQSPRDGVSKKMLVVVQPYNTLAFNENDSKKKINAAFSIMEVSRDVSSTKELGWG